ncbi:hypothetical protein GOODEAATRI_002936 [Goodea atripinnis]|uniref:Uncharacterized protein n=1 Tax=Goodea atripinnis TaxID=208336 RepID=A0ABV0PUW8_9TELE
MQGVQRRRESADHLRNQLIRSTEGLSAPDIGTELGAPSLPVNPGTHGEISESEGHFDTPEAATPVRAPQPVPGELENNNTNADKTDLEQEENLIVTVPVRDPDTTLSHNMGLDEPVVPVGGQLEIEVQNQDEGQVEHPSENLDSFPIPDSSSLKEEAQSTALLFEPSQDTNFIHEADPVPGLVPVPDPTFVPEPHSVASSEPAAPNASQPPELKPDADLEDHYNALPSHVEPTQKIKTSRSKPPSLKIKDPVSPLPHTDEEQEPPGPKATYNFDPDQLDDSYNPFTSGGSKIQNSPPPCGSSSLPRLEPVCRSLPACEATKTAQEDSEIMDPSSETKPVVLEFGLDDGTVRKPPPKKLGGKRTTSKIAAKKQKPKDSETSLKPAPEPTVLEAHPEPVLETAPELLPQSVSEGVSEQLSEPFAIDSSVPLNLDDVPIPKTGTYNFDPSQWDDPNFNPFGSNSKEEDEVVAQTPEITQRVHHATDEEKLASTGMIGQTTESQVEREGQECNKPAVKKQPSIPAVDVERSFADLFRRYENMKGVLEGFKKVGMNPLRCFAESCETHIDTA